MNVVTEEIEHCKFKVNYSADPEVVRAKEDEAVAHLRKQAVPGFRPGKAPDYAIKARCKKHIRTYVAREMLSNAFDDAVFEKKLKTVGSPSFESVNLDGHNFSCEMTILTRPEVVLGEYKGLEIPRPHMDRDVDAQIEATLEDLRLQFGDVEPYQEGDFVQKGDQITLDFSGTIGSEEFEGSTAEGMLYTIGQNRWPGFDDNLLGMAPGDEREFDIELPEELPVIGGKTAHFKVLLHMGTKKVPAPLDDELASKVGLQNMDEVRERISVIVKNRIQNTERSLIRQQVSNRLKEAHDITIPDWLVENDAKLLAKESNIDWNALSDDERPVFMEQAGERLKLSLILTEIMDQEPDATMSELEALQNLQSQVASQGADPEKFLVESRRNGTLQNMIAQMMTEFAMQWVVDQCKIIDE